MRAMSNDAAPAAVDATPRGQCERYSDETYAKMRDDEARTLAYDRAIALHSKGRTVLDIGTGALALLALSAARAGASGAAKLIFMRAKRHGIIPSSQLHVLSLLVSSFASRWIM